METLTSAIYVYRRSTSSDKPEQCTLKWLIFIVPPGPFDPENFIRIFRMREIRT